MIDILLQEKNLVISFDGGDLKVGQDRSVTASTAHFPTPHLNPAPSAGKGEGEGGIGGSDVGFKRQWF